MNRVPAINKTEISKIRDVADVVDEYLIAIHAGDTKQLAKIFEPGASLIGWDEGELRRVPLSQWLAFVDSIPSPKSTGVPFDGKIVSIDIYETVAVAKVTESYRSFKYVDYLSLVYDRGQWKIAAKCYHQFNDVA